MMILEGAKQAAQISSIARREMPQWGQVPHHFNLRMKVSIEKVKNESVTNKMLPLSSLQRLPVFITSYTK
jgi:hypothetical protein